MQLQYAILIVLFMYALAGLYLIKKETMKLTDILIYSLALIAGIGTLFAFGYSIWFYYIK